MVAALAIASAACGDAGSSDGSDDGSGGGVTTGPSTGPGSGSTTGAGGAPPIDTGCDGDPTAHTGEATYYDFADGSGNCGFPATPNDLMVGAMNHTDYAASAVCGACAEITGPNGTVKVRIVDQCPECPQGDIDLSPEAFAVLSPLDAGRIAITWTYVPCDVTGPIVFHFKDGSNPYWTAVQIRNHTYAIAKLEARMPPADYAEIPRVDYNYFVADAGLGDGPYDFRVTDVNGNVVESTGVPLLNDADAPGTGQFPICAANQ